MAADNNSLSSLPTGAAIRSSETNLDSGRILCVFRHLSLAARCRDNNRVHFPRNSTQSAPLLTLRLRCRLIHRIRNLRFARQLQGRA